MKKFFYLFVALVFVCSCHNRTPKYEFYTYMEAEQDFQASLTAVDTASVMYLSEAFALALQAGNVTGALDMLYVLDGSVLYKPSETYYNELVSRFNNFPVGEYELDRMSFSTAGNNDLIYTYSVATPNTTSNAMKMKLIFNPVKVGDLWYLTFKDGNQSSIDLDDKKQPHPFSMAPSEITLNVQE